MQIRFCVALKLLLISHYVCAGGDLSKPEPGHEQQTNEQADNLRWKTVLLGGMFLSGHAGRLFHPRPLLKPAPAHQEHELKPIKSKD